MNELEHSETERVIFAVKLLIWATAAAITGGLLFTAFPELDLAAIKPFYVTGDVFILGQNQLAIIARDVFQFLFVGVCAIAFAGVILGLTKYANLFGLTWIKWTYFLFCAAIGPGFLTNVLLKDYWGRARPNQIVEFGGSLQFSPALHLSNQCSNNCSFVGGESSTIYMLFFALALMADSKRKIFITLGLVLGTAAGMIRMGQGGHFASDIIFSGIFMAIVASVACIVFSKLLSSSK